MKPRKQILFYIAEDIYDGLNWQIKNDVHKYLYVKFNDHIIDILKHGMMYKLWDLIADQTYYKEVIK